LCDCIAQIFWNSGGIEAKNNPARVAEQLVNDCI